LGTSWAPTKSSNDEERPRLIRFAEKGSFPIYLAQLKICQYGGFHMQYYGDKKVLP